MSLLMQGYLKYTAWWDLDLLFRDEKSLYDFIDLPKSPDLRIVHYDEALMVGRSIRSFHTAWSFDRGWFNVDYLLRDNFFHHHYTTLKKRGPLRGRVELGDGREIHWFLFLAHPWDVFVEKLITSRFSGELDRRDSMGVDLRHIMIILNGNFGNPVFWKHTAAKASQLRNKGLFKKNLTELASNISELGYGDNLRPISLLSIVKSL